MIYSSCHNVPFGRDYRRPGGGAAARRARVERVDAVGPQLRDQRASHVV